MAVQARSLGVAYLLWAMSIFFICGLHHFYLGRWIRGLVWMLTLGLLGVGTLWDLFALPSQVRKAG